MFLSRSLTGFGIFVLIGLMDATAQPPSNYLIRPVSLIDLEHTRSNGERSGGFSWFNSSGQAVGYSNRYNGGSTDLGRSTWVYNGTSTVKVGLVDAEHTRIDGYKYGVATFTHAGDAPLINAAGHAAGVSARYDGATALGQSAWVYNGTATVRVGLTGTEYTGSGGYQHSDLMAFTGLNAAGQAAGHSKRFAPGTGDDLGQSTWVYNGATVRVGLYDPGVWGNEHIRSDDYQYSTLTPLGSTYTGKAAGIAERYNGGDAYLGQSVWVHNGTTTNKVGFTTGLFEREDHHKESSLAFFNPSGQAAGSSKRYLGFTDLGQTAWVYNGTTTNSAGLYASEHTRSGGYHFSDVLLFNAAGEAAGHSKRYNGGAVDLGQSTWVYSGGTIQVGLTDPEHTRDDGYQFSQLNLTVGLSSTGKVAGHSLRYNGGSANLGQTAWVYSGSTVRVGLTDGEHTRTDGYKFSNVSDLTEAGQAAGHSKRYLNSGTDLGQSAWVVSGTVTTRVGLYNPYSPPFLPVGPYTRTDGYQYSDVFGLNAAGKAAGHSTRFSGTTANGQATWVYNGTTTTRVGLSDLEHTRTDGYQYSEFDLTAAGGFVTSNGKAAGRSTRYQGSAEHGQSAWVYDGVTTHKIQLSQRADNFAFSQIRYFDDSGLALGYYRKYTGASYDGDRAFAFTVATGAYDLGLFIDGGLEANNWSYLADAIYAADGSIFGYGVMSGMPSGQVGFVVTPVPEPGIMIGVGALALVGAAAVRRKWRGAS
jgi:hypothetical protein